MKGRFDNSFDGDRQPKKGELAGMQQLSAEEWLGKISSDPELYPNINSAVDFLNSSNKFTQELLASLNERDLSNTERVQISNDIEIIGFQRDSLQSYQGDQVQIHVISASLEEYFDCTFETVDKKGLDFISALAISVLQDLLPNVKFDAGIVFDSIIFTRDDNLISFESRIYIKLKKEQTLAVGGERVTYVEAEFKKINDREFGLLINKELVYRLAVNDTRTTMTEKFREHPNLQIVENVNLIPKKYDTDMTLPLIYLKNKLKDPAGLPSFKRSLDYAKQCDEELLRFMNRVDTEKITFNDIVFINRLMMEVKDRLTHNFYYENTVDEGVFRVVPRFDEGVEESVIPELSHIVEKAWEWIKDLYANSKIEYGVMIDDVLYSMSDVLTEVKLAVLVSKKIDYTNPDASDQSVALFEVDYEYNDLHKAHVLSINDQIIARWDFVNGGFKYFDDDPDDAFV